MQLLTPTAQHLPHYVAALERGWSPNTERMADAAQEELVLVAADPEKFIVSQDDRAAQGPALKLLDGSYVARIPGFHRWMWDGEFCGSINLRWQPGTTALPPHCLGHIGYSVVPWKRGQGCAKRALQLMLPLARQEGLPFVEITSDADNAASHRVITACGGELVEHFTKSAQHGGSAAVRFRIALDSA